MGDARAMPLLMLASSGGTSKKIILLMYQRKELWTYEELKKFHKEAEVGQFLMCKVVVIFGLFGTTRGDEIYNLTMDDVKSEGNVFICSDN
ncbi:hypothetical protein Zmor_010732 [Zophobas morio]|uniref:Uncharacterized protein n=1 Tax=Zophobas morio TaxID=2755281 RepID=A0AA38IJH0_9CUCU|nr:hypothetical protein Zmor_010732 [Zophobas morio]